MIMVLFALKMTLITFIYSCAVLDKRERPPDTGVTETGNR